jgi:putative ABC transport system permease protein
MAGGKMYRNILKKDLKRKKTMNLILFLFIVLAATFIASSVNNMLSVYTALDGYFQKAGIPDYWFTVADKNDCAKFEEKGYDSKTLELLQINPTKIEINGEKFSYSESTVLSTLENSTKIFNSTDDKEITNIPDGEIYMSSVIVGNEEYDLHVGDTVTISFGDKQKSFTLAGSVKDAIFGSEMMGMTRILVSDSDFSFFGRDDSHCQHMPYSHFICDSALYNQFHNE